MKFIQSQYITENLTHLTRREGYEGMKKNGIKICDKGEDSLTYKPPGFFISINGEWEEWCTSENFRDVSRELICNVYLKPNLMFIRISTIEDADELVRFLMPDMQKIDLGFRSNDSDLLNFSRYTLTHMARGEIVTPRQVWKKALDTCDGIYYENSGVLHFETFFNTWDVSSILLFDPRNAILSYQGF